MPRLDAEFVFWSLLGGEVEEGGCGEAADPRPEGDLDAAVMGVRLMLLVLEDLGVEPLAWPERVEGLLVGVVVWEGTRKGEDLTFDPPVGEALPEVGEVLPEDVLEVVLDTFMVLEVLVTVTELEEAEADTAEVEAVADEEEEVLPLKADLMASKFLPVKDLGTGLPVLAAVTEVFLGLGELPLSKMEIRSEIGFLLARIDMFEIGVAHGFPI